MRESVQRTKAEQAPRSHPAALEAATSSIISDSFLTQKELSDEQKKFLRKVLTYYKELAEESGDDEASRLRTMHAAYRVGDIESRLGHMTEAVAANYLARDKIEKLVAEFPALPKYREGLADIHNRLGTLLSSLGTWAEAEQHYRNALTIQEKLVLDVPAQPQYRLEMAQSLNNLGSLLKNLGQRGGGAEA